LGIPLQFCAHYCLKNLSRRASLRAGNFGLIFREKQGSPPPSWHSASSSEIACHVSLHRKRLGIRPLLLLFPLFLRLFSPTFRAPYLIGEGVPDSPKPPFLFKFIQAPPDNPIAAHAAFKKNIHPPPCKHWSDECSLLNSAVHSISGFWFSFGSRSFSRSFEARLSSGVSLRSPGPVASIDPPVGFGGYLRAVQQIDFEFSGTVGRK